MRFVGIMNHRRIAQDDHEDKHQAERTCIPDEIDENERRGCKVILLSPGPLVSLSRLLSKSKLRGIKVKGESGAAAGKLLLRKLSNLGLGRILTFRVRRNNSVVSNGYKLYLIERASLQSLYTSEVP